jgi:hypothetical protein
VIEVAANAGMSGRMPHPRATMPGERVAVNPNPAIAAVVPRHNPINADSLPRRSSTIAAGTLPAELICPCQGIDAPRVTGQYLAGSANLAI